MAPKTPKAPKTPAPAAADPTPTADISEFRAAELLAADATEAPQAPAAPRPPQGIVIRLRQTGDERKDFHPYFRQIRMIDPASLVVDGQDPFLALPLPGQPGEELKYRIRQFPAKHAADLLVCDRSTGGPSTVRLATDAEVEQYHQEMEARRRK